jgi:hypothetical protein
VRFFRNDYCKLRSAERERLTTALLDRIFPILLDKRLRAMFGASQPSLHFDEIAAKNKRFCLIFRHVLDPDLRRFLLLLVFTYFYEWVKHGDAARNPLA